MTHEQADILLFYLQNIDGVFRADVYDRTADATIHYKGNRETIIEGLRRFRYEEVEVPNGLLETSGRAMNAEYQEKLVDKILFHYGRKFLLPYPISAAYTTIMSAKYIWKGIKTLMERLKFRYWMQQQSEYQSSEVISVRQVRSCSCLESVNS